uniref:Transmembrane protein 255B n=1 Tax=Equus asinus asinus TaxID=83772 RepID=A0A8C4MWE4_EQUAS
LRDKAFERRKKTSLWFVGSLLVVSVLILTIGLSATTRTENVTVGGYYPGIIVSPASPGSAGQGLVAAVVFLSFGVAAAFCCATVDGVFAARHIVSPIFLFWSARSMPLPGITCGALWHLWAETRSSSGLSLSGSSTASPALLCRGARLPPCSCGDALSHAMCSSEHPPAYYEFVGVSSCQDVLHLHRLLWASAGLNVLGLLLGIVTAAVLGAFKDMVPVSQLAFGRSTPEPEPPVGSWRGAWRSSVLLHVDCVSGWPSPLTEEAFSVQLQPSGSVPASPPTDLSLSEDAQPPSQPSSSLVLPPHAPPLYVPAHFLPGEKPPPYTP